MSRPARARRMQPMQTPGKVIVLCSGGMDSVSVLYDAHARGHTIDLFKVFVIDTINAERAFLHHALGLIKFTGAIGAGPSA